MTLPKAAPRGHEWTFTSSTMAEPPVALLIAVCRRCGLVRSEVATPRREFSIDLSGDCAG
jgi:hypothetical protein